MTSSFQSYSPISRSNHFLVFLLYFQWCNPDRIYFGVDYRAKIPFFFPVRTTHFPSTVDYSFPTHLQCLLHQDSMYIQFVSRLFLLSIDLFINYFLDYYSFMLLLLSHFSRVRLCATPQTAAHQAPPSLVFSRQEHWSGLTFPSPMHKSETWKGSCSVVSDS